jgi:GNAT superfamily N-acetyltransferase
MATDPQFATRELSLQTWPGFEWLFSQGGGWDFCCCTFYHRGCHLTAKQARTRAESHTQNLREKKRLVGEGRVRGILVYRNGGSEPVGWCKYGRVEELPLAGLADPGRKISDQASDPTSQWRIPCFVTRKEHRRQGVARTALAAALESIQSNGGGWVEGTPIAGTYSLPQRYYQAVKAHGKDSPEARRYIEEWPSVTVPGVGPVPAEPGGFGSRAWVGTVSMFAHHGFEAVKIVKRSRVLMRRHV